jgi:hypothetical protein
MCVAGLLSFGACSERKADPEEVEYTVSIEDVLARPSLKVLDIGNSYSNDVFALLPTVVENCNADVSNMCLYKVNRGGSSFKTWFNIYSDKVPDSYSFDRVLGGLSVPVSTGEVTLGDGSYLRSILSDVEWDIIIIHPYSTHASNYELWGSNGDGGYLLEFLDILKQNQPKALIGFMIVHSYWDDYSGNTEKSSLVRWQKIADSVQHLQKDYGITFIIPYGTAIENIRSSSLNNNYDLTRDGTHCGYGLCQYTAACSFYESLIALWTGVSCYGSPAQIDVSKITSGYPAVSVTDSIALIAQKAALLALQDMYHCNNPEE